MSQPLILRIFKSGALVEVKQFLQFPVVFGRPGAEVHVFLEDETVSPIHALIDERQGEFYICDLGSQGGTFKNGQPVLDELLRSGDRLRIGVFEIEVIVGIPKPKVAPQSQVAPQSPVSPQDRVVRTEVAQKPAVPPPPIVDSPSPSSSSIPADLAKPGLGSVAQASNEAPIVGAKTASSSAGSAAATSTSSSAAPKTVTTASAVAAKTVTYSATALKGSAPWHRKKVTFAPVSPVEDLKSYLKPSEGPGVQVIMAWRERVLEVIYVSSQQKQLLWNELPLYPQAFADKPLVIRSGGELTLLLPGHFRVEVVTAKNRFSKDELTRLGRGVMTERGWSYKLQDGELVEILSELDGVEYYVRRVPESRKPIPVGFLDVSSTELTGLIVSLVIVGLLALYMSIYAPVTSAPPEVEEVRIAEFVYNKPPAPTPPPTPPAPEPKVETPPPPPPKPEEPKKIKVTDEKKPEYQKPQLPKKEDVGSTKAGLRPVPNPNPNAAQRAGSLKAGSSVATSPEEGANAASAEADVSQTGLLSAFGGGGNRSKLDKAYSGSGQLLGMAGKSTGFTGQKENRDGGDDLGAKLKTVGQGGQGIATEGISGIGTKGRGSGDAGYGTVGTGSGKGRVTIDVPGNDAEFVGTIDKEAVRRVIRSILSQIRACYERSLRRDPTLTGKVVINFEIGAGGRVVAARPKSNTLADSSVGSCVAERIQEQRFPEPPGGTIAVVAYPFVFDAQK